jgi:hypothetical protein
MAWLAILGGALLLSLASLMYQSQRLSGTGTHVSRGFPRSFYFTWADNLGSDYVYAGMNWSYFAVNWLIWAMVLAALAGMVRLLRLRRAAAS